MIWSFKCLLRPPSVVAAKGSYGTEGQLHTVMEKSPESSPTTKPRQGGAFSQPHSPAGHSPTPQDPAHQPGPGKHPLPQPEPHNGSSAPGLAQDQDLQSSGGREERRDGRTSATENGYQHLSSPPAFAPAPLRADR